MLDCGNCGLEFAPTRADGLYHEDDEHTCADCGAVNVIGVDSRIEDDEVPEAYVIGWRCRHGADDETPCAACEIEDASSGDQSPREVS